MEHLTTESRLLELAHTARQAILPHLDNPDSRIIDGRAETGDVTFRLDVPAEEALRTETPRLFPGAALFSEDAGLRTFGVWDGRVIVADPIDGTRPASAGLENACVSLALAGGGEAGTYADVTAGVLVEVRSGRACAATRTRGTRRYEADGSPAPVRLSPNEELGRLYWSFEICCRPAMPLMDLYSGLMDLSSWKGGCFSWSSCAFSIARLLSGQVDAYVDAWSRLAREFPEDGALGRRIFGRPCGLMPYDMAAAQLIAREAGCVVTDASGNSLDGIRLQGCGESDMFSCVAASNAALHARLIGYLNERVGERSQAAALHPSL